MNTAIKLPNNEKGHNPNSNLSLLDDNELKSINGGAKPVAPLFGWKAAALIVGGTGAAIIVGVAGTYLLYKGVEYLLTD